MFNFQKIEKTTVFLTGCKEDSHFTISQIKNIEFKKPDGNQLFNAVIHVVRVEEDHPSPCWLLNSYLRCIKLSCYSYFHCICVEIRVYLIFSLEDRCIKKEFSEFFFYVFCVFCELK